MGPKNKAPVNKIETDLKLIYDQEIIDTWNDKSSNGNNLIPHNSNNSNPLTGVNSQNGLNVITFDGDDILTINSSNNIGDFDQTWFIVAKVDVGGVSVGGDGIIAYD